MDFPCESEINVQNDKALRFSVATKPVPIIEYLKTIASLIGASHILGVFEDNNSIKVYFDDKRYVDTLIRSGIHIMGHHIKVDYVIPPGSKVTFSNVDPVITNDDLIALISTFGSVMSPVFRLPISDEVEFCHIDYGVRYVYVNLIKPLPDFFEFRHYDHMCRIDVKLDDHFPPIRHVKNEPIESNSNESSISPDNSTDPIIVDNEIGSTDPVLVSVHSASEEINSEQLNETIEEHVEGNNSVTSKRNLYKTRRAKYIKNSQINKKIKHIKYKRRPKKFLVTRRKKRNINLSSKKESLQLLTPSAVQPSFTAYSSSPDDNSALLSDINDTFVDENYKEVLDNDKLLLFLDEVRCHRAPIELVKKYLGPNFDYNALLSLIKQLTILKNETQDLAFKVRIRRLINNLKNFLNA